MNFYKYQANGNDFILTEDACVDVKGVCHRHFGIGADGVLLVNIVDDVCEYMHYNADGSMAAFCGNGICCVADWYMKVKDTQECRIKMEDTVYDLFYDDEDIILKVPCPLWIEKNRYRCGVEHVVIADSMEQDTVNMNFVDVLDRNTLRVQTMETGVGWTLSCGSGNIVSFYHHYLCDAVNETVCCINEGGSSMLWIEDRFIYCALRVVEVFVGIY